MQLNDDTNSVEATLNINTNESLLDASDINNLHATSDSASNICNPGLQIDKILENMSKNPENRKDTNADSDWLHSLLT